MWCCFLRVEVNLRLLKGIKRRFFFVPPVKKVKLITLKVLTFILISS